MPATREVESTLTDRYQTTIPETVRRALGLGKRDKIHYAIRPDGEVLITRAPLEGDDPVLGEFLDFLARDMSAHPAHLQALDGSLVQHIRTLVEGVEFDLDAALPPMANEAPTPMVAHGWTLFAHPLFISQLEGLIRRVEDQRRRDPGGYRQKGAAKRLAAIAKLTCEVIPQDPARAEYRQGSTLGSAHKHWFRAKFFQQYRLFFRYHAQSKVIVYAWVNDEDSKRAYESDDDAYKVFRKMLESGLPPGDWEILLQEARAESERFHQAASQSTAAFGPLA